MRSFQAVALRAIAALAMTITISSTAAFGQSAKSAAPANPAATALAAARTSLNKVLNAPSPNGEAFKKLALLKAEYIALEKAASTASPAWSAHSSAIDRLVSELIGNDSSTVPSPVGTSGRAGDQPANLDAGLRANLQEFRRHLTAFSAAMAAVAPAKSTAASTTEAASATAAAPAKLPPDPPEATTTAAAPPATVAAPPPLAAPITPAAAETSPPDAAAAQTAAAQTATIEGKPSTPAQPEATAVGTSGNVDRLAAMIDNALTNAPDSSGKLYIDRALLEQIKKEIETLRANK